MAPKPSVGLTKVSARLGPLAGWLTQHGLLLQSVNRRQPRLVPPIIIVPLAHLGTLRQTVTAF